MMPRSPKRIHLRELEWNNGWSVDQVKTVIYTNGHIDKEEFLRVVKESPMLDTPRESRDALTAENVSHCRFRPMSPSEAREKGYDSGVMKDESGRWKVTMVEL